MRLVFLGSPGAGKGTYAQEVIKHYSVPQVSTGDLLRQAVKEGTKLGIKAKEYMDSGALVPDELMISMVSERFKQHDCKNGFLLDGFPRTLAQGSALDGILKELGKNLDAVININVDHEILMRRLTGRRVCKKCGAIYNIYTMKPKVEDICDKCQGGLYQREDDRQETIENRLLVYEKQTEPLIHFYRKQLLLREVMATGDDVSSVVREICSLSERGI